MYADRHHPYSGSSTSSSRLSDPLAGTSSPTTSGHSMSATSAHSRVALCSSEAVGRSGSSGRSGGKGEEEKPRIDQYTTPTTTTTMYLLVNYLGDAAGAVDDHFNRALNPSLYDCKS